MEKQSAKGRGKAQNIKAQIIVGNESVILVQHMELLISLVNSFTKQFNFS